MTTTNWIQTAIRPFSASMSWQTSPIYYTYYSLRANDLLKPEPILAGFLPKSEFTQDKTPTHRKHKQPCTLTFTPMGKLV